MLSISRSSSNFTGAGFTLLLFFLDFCELSCEDLSVSVVGLVPMLIDGLAGIEGSCF